MAVTVKLLSSRVPVVTPCPICSLYLNESQMFSDIELLAVFPTLQSTIHRYSQHNKVMSYMYVIFVHICC